MRKLLFATCAALAILAGTAHADPISAAIVGAVGLTGVAATAATFVITTGLTFAVQYGLSKISAALKPKPQAGQPLSGLELSVQIGGDIDYQIPLGQVRLKGQLIYHNTNGAQNQFHQQVFVLADWRCDSLASVLVDGKPYALTLLSASGAMKEYGVTGLPGQSGAFYPLKLRFYDGSQTTADAALVSASNPVGKWTANSIVTGKCYVAALWDYVKPTESQTDYDLFESGIPELDFVTKAAKLYDWRKDSTNGGAGAHRWNDAATWEFSDNPVVGLYNYLRGFYIAGELVLGMGVQAYDIDHASFTAAANVCDELVALDAGGTEKRYRAAIILTADPDVPHATTLDAILATCAGYLYDYAGTYVAQAGAAQASVKTVTDADLVIGQPVTFAAKRSRADLVNTIHGQFLDPVANYQPSSYSAWRDAGAVTNDREELGKTLDLVGVPSGTQAGRIAKIRGREVRAQASAAITLGFNHVDLQAGDWITWNSVRFGNRTWRIAEREVDADTRAVSLELAEINAAVFSWAAADEGVQPAVPVALQRTAPASTVAGFGVQADVVTNADGRVLPALVFSWTPVTDPTVEAVIIEYRPVGSLLPALRARDETPEDGTFVVTEGVVGGTNYEARASLRTSPARGVTWTAWAAVLTADEQIAFQQLTAQIKAELALLTNNAEGSLRDLRERALELIEQLAHDAALELGVAYEERKVIRSQGSTTARQTSVLQTEVVNTKALVVSEQTARASADEALASDITLVEAIANQGTASGLIKLEAASAPAGVTARFAVYLKASAGDTFKDAGFYLDIVGGVARAIFKVDQFAVTSGGAAALLPFAVSGGNVYVGNDLVVTGSIIANGVTETTSAFTAAEIEIVGDTLEYTLQSLAVTKAANDRLLFLINIYGDNKVSNTDLNAQAIQGQFNLMLYRDAVLVRRIESTLPVRRSTGGFTYKGNVTIIVDESDLSAGTYTYTLKVSNQNFPFSPPAPSLWFKDRLLVLLKTKR